MTPEERNKKIASLEAELKELKNEYFCSFCGKSSHELLVLIAGPTSLICDECVSICVGIIDDRKIKLRAEGGDENSR